MNCRPKRDMMAAAARMQAAAAMRRPDRSRMRPTCLNPLFAPVTSLAGRRAEAWTSCSRRLLGRDESAAAGRPAAAPAGRRDRPPGAAEAPRRGARHRGDRDVHVDRHRPPPPGRSRAPYLVYASDDTGDVVLTYFSAQPGLSREAAAGRRDAYVSGTPQIYDGMLQMVHPDRVVDEADFAKLPLVEPVYPLTEGLALDQVRRAIAPRWPSCRRCRNGRTPPCCARCGFPPLPKRCARCIARPNRTTCCRTARPGRGSPMTNCWPASWRWRWCARICAASAGTRQRRRRPSARQDHRRPALCADRLAAAAPSPTIAADLRAAAAHAAAAAGRRRLRQDRGGAARRRRGDRGRQAGGADGADRNPRAPASRRPSRRSPRRPGSASRSSPAAKRAASATRHSRAARRRRDRPPRSAPMRCSRTTSPSTISRSPWSTSSIASACTSAWR